MRNISAATTLAVLFSSVALGVAAAGPASAATATVASPGGIVVDGALQRVFVGDSTAGKILATDYAGNLVDSVSGVAGVTDLTVSDDGTTVYAAAREVHEVMAFDAATLTLKARYTVPDLYGPRYIAFAGGKVWFTYGDQGDGAARVLHQVGRGSGWGRPGCTGAAPAAFGGRRVQIRDPGWTDRPPRGAQASPASSRFAAAPTILGSGTPTTSSSLSP
ncbi:hypothetical protein PV342_10465 [Streptomyces sp. PA03-3a]|nr:hypothetical protein [Streptomyces sp. PA03-3a]